MQTKFIDETFVYDGTQLRSLYAYLEHGILGDSAVAWVGPCHLKADKIVDAEDLRQNSKIEADEMLHFIVEAFDVSLFSMASLQRLMGSLVQDFIFAKTGVSLVRYGDDLYKMQTQSPDLDQKPVKNIDLKLNISIATKSPTSALMHFGINVSTQGTPIKTLSLRDLDLEVKSSALVLLARLQAEFEGLRKATQKVKWVK